MTPKFLICPDAENKQLYILHTETPRCLMLVVQKTPLQLEFIDEYDDVEVEDVGDLIYEAKQFLQTVVPFDQN